MAITVESEILFFKDSKSDKYYRAILEGMKVTCNWGRTGTVGETQIKEFSSTFAAREFYVDKIASKRAKGYRDLLDSIPKIEPPINTGLLKKSIVTQSGSLKGKVLSAIKDGMLKPKQHTPEQARPKRKFRFED